MLAIGKIEEKWQATWEREGLAKVDLAGSKKPFYLLVMFPYPSADRLHIGHWYNFGPADTVARWMKMQGYDVFEPMGFDAFGLPAENHAIRSGVHPADSTSENIAKMREQLRAIGALYDWEHQVITSDPEYYKWTQWIFLKFFEAGLAYQKEAPANWCPSCQTVLANEQVINGLCERCDTEVIQKSLTQWIFATTKYADRLLKNLDKLDWPETTRQMQRNWIGRSEGARITFPVHDSELHIETFTTRPDTLFGATYLVLAPEHPLVPRLATSRQRAAVAQYQEAAKRLRELERLAEAREKTGVFTGSYARNPASGEKIPIWIADYVLLSYGTGAIMAVPAHDSRDFAFAKKFSLPVKTVIRHRESKLPEEAWTGEGGLISSGRFSGMDWQEGGRAIIAHLARKKLAQPAVVYRMRDWLISRQRYWGAPIPIVHCERHGAVAMPEDELPVTLPRDVDYTPRGKPPLASATDFVRTTCPKDGKPARREVETMDTFVDSSWYFLRYLSPHLREKPWDNDLVRRWCPVHLYIGGAEHATMHLIYARFVTMALHDLGLLPIEEPFTKLRHQGLITYRGAKMSKSRGNVVEPDPFVARYGSDAFRMALMFLGPYDEGADWTDRGIVGLSRFLERLSRLFEKPYDREKRASRLLFERVAFQVNADLSKMRFNTAIAKLMEFTNYLAKKGTSKRLLEDFVKLLAPFAPHLAEELWREKLGHRRSIFLEAYPKGGEEKTREVTIPVQINGKIRASLTLARDASEKEALERARRDARLPALLSGKKITKTVYIPSKILSLVVS